MKKFVALFSIALAIVLYGAIAHAAELKVLSVGVLRSALTDLLPNYERMTGDKVAITYDFAGAVKTRFEKGEPGDVVILSKPDLVGLAKMHKIAADSITVIARSGMALGVRKGMPKPDIGSVDAVKKFLLAAKSIAFLGAPGNPDGVVVRRIIDSLRIAKEVSGKLKPIKTVDELGAEKDADILLTQPPALLASANYDMVGMLPAQLQDPDRYIWSAGTAAKASDPETAGVLIRFLAAPNSGPVFKAKGMVPP
jgi:molybdate transport system substrate-binding protein